MKHNIWKQIQIILWIGIGSAVLGCGPQTQTPPDGKPDKDYGQVQTTAEKGYELRYGEIKDNEGKALETPPLNQYFSVVVTLKSAAGAPPKEGTKLQLEAQMPEHGHGMNTKAEVVAQGDGKYMIKGLLFHMPGWWELTMEVEGPDGTKEEATFNVYLEVG